MKISYENWEVCLAPTEEGLLNVYVSHADKSSVLDVSDEQMDVHCDTEKVEINFRLTTEKIAES